MEELDINKILEDLRTAYVDEDWDIVNIVIDNISKYIFLNENKEEFENIE